MALHSSFVLMFEDLSSIKNFECLTHRYLSVGQMETFTLVSISYVPTCGGSSDVDGLDFCKPSKGSSILTQSGLTVSICVTSLLSLFASFFFVVEKMLTSSEILAYKHV